jgi:hypothetical protein
VLKTKLKYFLAIAVVNICVGGLRSVIHARKKIRQNASSKPITLNFWHVSYLRVGEFLKRKQCVGISPTVYV